MDGFHRTPAPYQYHNEEIVNHLYNAGFQTGVRSGPSTSRL